MTQLGPSDVGPGGGLRARTRGGPCDDSSRAEVVPFALQGPCQDAAALSLGPLGPRVSQVPRLFSAGPGHPPSGGGGLATDGTFPCPLPALRDPVTGLGQSAVGSTSPEECDCEEISSHVMEVGWAVSPENSPNLPVLRAVTCPGHGKVLGEQTGKKKLGAGGDCFRQQRRL